MEIIAIERMRDYFIENLPKYKTPVFIIATQNIPGCPKCDSHTSVFYIGIIESDKIDEYKPLIEIEKHKLPIPVYFQKPLFKKMPKKMVVGTQEKRGKLEMVIRRIMY